MKNQQTQKFSPAGRAKSFRYAIRGIFLFMKTQHNAWIHLVAAIVVTIAGFYFSLSGTEWIAVILAIGFVFSAEAFNTAIEWLVDKISPEYDPVAGKVKDVAAGAVLIAAVAAAVIGILVFFPKIFG